MASFVGFLIFTILILKIDGECVEQSYTGVTVAENGALGFTNFTTSQG